MVGVPVILRVERRPNPFVDLDPAHSCRLAKLGPTAFLLWQIIAHTTCPEFDVDELAGRMGVKPPVLLRAVDRLSWSVATRVDGLLVVPTPQEAK